MVSSAPFQDERARVKEWRARPRGGYGEDGSVCSSITLVTDAEATPPLASNITELTTSSIVTKYRQKGAPPKPTVSVCPSVAAKRRSGAASGRGAASTGVVGRVSIAPIVRA